MNRWIQLFLLMLCTLPASAQCGSVLVTATRTSGLATLSVSLSANPPTGCDPSVYTWTFLNWDFGDGSPASYTTQTTHSYTRAGTFATTATYEGDPCDTCANPTILVSGSV